MSREGELLDAFLRAHRDSDEREMERLLETAPTDALRRLLELRRQAGRLRARVEDGAEAEADLPFERLGEFRLVRRLGAGGMGELFVAEQESLGRTVALKVIQRSLLASPTARERFRREALAAARLHHPNLVTVFATGEDRGLAYIAMAYVHGDGMDELIRRSRGGGERLGTRRVVRWGARLARALAYAHERGVLHRDVKPSNVVVGPDDEPILLDFGIARDERWAGRTVTEAFTGSLHYAAPEQVAGRVDRLDGRTDVYALAATLYEALTGRLPVPGGSPLEALLTHEPVPPRRYNPALSPDLQTVLLKALAKSPSARYADATAFADDLEAVLELRPIAARAPHVLERLRRFARRRPRLAAAGLGAGVALLLFAGYRAHALRAEARETRREAGRLVAAAADRLAAHRSGVTDLAALEERVVALRHDLHLRYTTPEEEATLDEGERRLAEARRSREATYHEVLELLRRSRELDPDVAHAAQVRTDLYMQRWRDARRARDTDATRFFGGLVRAHDHAGRHAAELDEECRVRVTTDPPGAEIHLFRLIEHAEVVPGGQRRLVPVPADPDAPRPVPPGTVVARVVGGPEGWRAGDLVLRVAGRPAADARDRLEHGGAPVEVFRGGRTESVRVPEGLEVRWTAAPAFVSAATHWATTPSGERTLPRGRWLLIARREGFLEQRVAFDTAESRSWDYVIPLELESEAVPGFVRVHRQGPRDGTFRIMEREVTAAEYLAFLNDPSIRARIDANVHPVLYPREVAGSGVVGYWPRAPDGRFSVPADWAPDWPVVGVSWHDAQAYARWRTGRAESRGRAVRFALPDYRQWIAAANGNALSDYPFGDHFRPKWVSSCFSRPTTAVEPVLAYPVDESVFGVFDMAGSAAEWLDTWYDEAKGLQRVGGGSWAHADPEHLKLYGRGQRPDSVSGTTGFRLVLEDAR